jgi:hypothetical protein
MFPCLPPPIIHHNIATQAGIAELNRMCHEIINWIGIGIGIGIGILRSERGITNFSLVHWNVLSRH